MGRRIFQNQTAMLQLPHLMYPDYQTISGSGGIGQRQDRAGKIEPILMALFGGLMRDTITVEKVKIHIGMVVALVNQKHIFLQQITIDGVDQVNEKALGSGTRIKVYTSQYLSSQQRLVPDI
jgi:hypothetical protein